MGVTEDRLSKDFKLSEFFCDGDDRDFVKDAGKQYADRIKTQLVEPILQPLRDKLGYIKITSGVRSKKVNDKYVPKGWAALNSDHLYRLGRSACDIWCRDMDGVMVWLKENKTTFWYAYRSNSRHFIHISGIPKSHVPEDFKPGRIWVKE